MTDLSFREALNRARGVWVRVHNPDDEWDTSDWLPARWWRFRSWHPIVGAHRQAWLYFDRRSFTLYLCCGDYGGGSDSHEQAIYVRWWPTISHDRLIGRKARVRPRVFWRTVRSWWFDSEGFRGLLGPWEMVPGRGGPPKAEP